MVLASILFHASLHHTARKNKYISLLVHIGLTGSAYAYCNALMMKLEQMLRNNRESRYLCFKKKLLCKSKAKGGVPKQCLILDI